MAAQSTSTNSASDPSIDIGNAYTPRRPAPIIGISINHPIATVARKIKNFLIHKQTLFATTFSIKVTPIVAMVSLLGVAALFGGGITTAFNFGKTVEQKFLATTPTPTPKVVVVTPAVIVTSKTGTIKATYQLPVLVSSTPSPTNTPAPTDIGTISAAITSAPTVTPIPSASSGQTILHYILVSRSGSILYLVSSTVTLQNYLGLKVLITGGFNNSKNTLTISKSSDIEVLQ